MDWLLSPTKVELRRINGVLPAGNSLTVIKVKINYNESAIGGYFATKGGETDMANNREREDSCEEALMPIPNPQGAEIRKVANGFIITVGCKTFVSKDWGEVATGLGEYWENPTVAEKKFCK